jgi:hypothetical protein
VLLLASVTVISIDGSMATAAGGRQWKEYDLKTDAWGSAGDVMEVDHVDGGMPPTTSASQDLEEGDLDVHKLSQRQKQIDFGKNTLGYTNYLQQVPVCVSERCSAC